MLDRNQKITLLASLLLTACTHVPVQAPASGHLQQSDIRSSVADTAIPQPVQSSMALPPPKAVPKAETYSVVVQNVSAQELLFALARDAKLNVDVHPGINGTVTLNAIDQTLQQLLTRISKQVDMRWELDGPNLIVTPDTPYLRTYTVDYVNMARDTSVSTSVNSQVSSGTGVGSSSGGNSSTTKVDNTSQNHFWETLEKNLKDILRETDKILPGGSSDTVIEQQDEATANTQLADNGKPASANPRQSGAKTIHRTTFREAASVIANAEAGVITVRATSRQHEKIVEFLDSVMNSARRQVMIEATILQVDLSDGYKQGIDWSRVRADGSGFSIKTPSLSTGTSSIVPFTLGRTDNSNPLNLDLTVQLLNNFGTVKVLSSPKLSVLNNQTAVLKVVDNFVYFNVKSDVTSGSTGAAQKSFTTTAQTVSVGLVMSVTPQIGADHSIILNVRPSISSISGFTTDPNPDLVTIQNRVPQIQTREIESVMRLSNGEIAVLGGLMQESSNYQTGKIPGAGSIPFWGELFTKRDNATSKSELVVFLRPVVVENPSITGDYGELRSYLPAADFNAAPAHARQFEPTFDNNPQGASH
ncbi:MAG: pilus (MSHA type) biogenesis protein MshL [Georgfuchsia sp.]